MSFTAIMLVSASIVLVLLVVAEVISLAAPNRFLSSVILGEDGRTSTSKTFIFMWTLLVAWALIALLIAGEFVPAHHCIGGLGAGGPVKRCRNDDVALLQLGWTHFLHSGLAGSYLILLGIPAAAGIAAKGITQSQAQSSTAVKTVKTSKQSSVFSRIAEIFSSDDGSTDIADFQYVIFNLITAAYFVARFLRPDINGLPTIPDTLLGLTSVSAGLYVGKKAVTRNQPSVSGVFPSILLSGHHFTVVGTGLVEDPSASTIVNPQITIDGVQASDVREVNTTLVAIVPPNLGAAGGGTVTRQLQVLNPYGGVTANFSVQCM